MRFLSGFGDFFGGLFGDFGGVTRLPNSGRFSSLHSALKAYNPSLAQAAFMAGDAFDMAIVAAAKQDKANFGKFFNMGVGKTSQLAPHMSRSSAVGNMYSWLTAAQNHSQTVGQKHLARTQEQQAKYDVGARGAMRIRENVHREKAGLPPVSPTDWSGAAKGIASILTPLAQAGAGAYAANLRAQAGRGRGAPPPPAYFPPPPPPKSKMGLIILLSVLGVGGIITAVVLTR